VAHPFLIVLTLLILTKDSLPPALLTRAAVQFITEARRAYFEIEQAVQVFVYELAHIDIGLFHILIMLILHVDHNVPGFVRQ
jgi:hypothetical protein